MRRIIVAVLAIAAGGAAHAAGLSVTGVAANDTLSLRAAPDSKSAKVGALAPDATGIAVTAVGTTGEDWIKVSKGNVSGWANARFLAYENGAPVRLKCTGTEPFWSASIGYGTASLSFNGESPQRLALDEPDMPAARRNPFLYPVRGQARSFILIDKTGKCSPGMGDQTFTYSALVKAKGYFMDGCCS